MLRLAITDHVVRAVAGTGSDLRTRYKTRAKRTNAKSHAPMAEKHRYAGICCPNRWRMFKLKPSHRPNP